VISCGPGREVAVEDRELVLLVERAGLVAAGEDLGAVEDHRHADQAKAGAHQVAVGDDHPAAGHHAAEHGVAEHREAGLAAEDLVLEGRDLGLDAVEAVAVDLALAGVAAGLAGQRRVARLAAAGRRGRDGRGLGCRGRVADRGGWTRSRAWPASRASAWSDFAGLAGFAGAGAATPATGPGRAGTASARESVRAGVARGVAYQGAAEGQQPAEVARISRLEGRPQSGDTARSTRCDEGRVRRDGATPRG
jgi:hypothetical protein